MATEISTKREGTADETLVLERGTVTLEVSPDRSPDADVVGFDLEKWAVSESFYLDRPATVALRDFLNKILERTA